MNPRSLTIRHGDEIYRVGSVASRSLEKALRRAIANEGQYFPPEFYFHTAEVIEALLGFRAPAPVQIHEGRDVA